MKSGLLALGVILGLVLTTGHSPAQSQSFAATEAAVGYTASAWSFMTGWDLTGGGLQVSPNWFSGDSVWNFSQPHFQHWTAKFMYDLNTGSTRELQWSYTQIHIQ